MVKLGEVLQPVSRPEIVDPLHTYRLLGAHWYAGGLYTKDVKLGSAVQAKWLYRVEEGDFVYNRLFAWKGSFALATADNAGCYVSNEFPCFVVRSDRVDGRYLWRYFSRGSAWEEALGLSTGGTPTSRNRLKEEKLLAMQIPLPPLAEQRRIVARIEELATKIEKARTFSRKAADEADMLLNTARRTTIAECDSQTVPLECVCVAIIDNLHSNPRLSETGIPCVRSPDVGYGTLELDGAQRTDEEEYRRRTARGEPQADDIVLVREGGGTGKCAVVAPGDKFSLGQRVMMLRPDKGRILPRFFLHQLLSPLVQSEQIGPLCKGSASPHLNIGALKRFSFRLPTLSAQRRIVAELDGLQAKMDELKRLQAETAAELDALLPSTLDRAFRGQL